MRLTLKLSTSCLNPFEVREVLQELIWPKVLIITRLNPFEVREVLQDV